MMESSSYLDYPHIYKKGKILKFKNLDTPKTVRNYLFSSGNTSLQKLANHANNINQIVARCWLKLAKLNSYLGLEQDVSNKLSKKPSPWNKFLTDIKSTLKEGGNSKDNERLSKILIELENLNKKINEIEEKLKPTSEGEEKVLAGLDKIQTYLKGMLGA